MNECTKSDREGAQIKVQAKRCIILWNLFLYKKYGFCLSCNNIVKIRGNWRVPASMFCTYTSNVSDFIANHILSYIRALNSSIVCHIIHEDSLITKTTTCEKKKLRTIHCTLYFILNIWPFICHRHTHINWFYRNHHCGAAFFYRFRKLLNSENVVTERFNSS